MMIIEDRMDINPLNAELNPICHLLALLGGATILVVSRLRVKWARFCIFHYNDEIITFEIQFHHNCAHRPCCCTFCVEFEASHPQVLLATANIFFDNNVPNNNRCSSTVPCNNTHSGGRWLLKLLPAGKFCIILSLRSELSSCTAQKSADRFEDIVPRESMSTRRYRHKSRDASPFVKRV
jgi:hypothetical protein